MNTKSTRTTSTPKSSATKQTKDPVKKVQPVSKLRQPTKELSKNNSGNQTVPRKFVTKAIPNSSGIDYFQYLPNEIILEIIQFLDVSA